MRVDEQDEDMGFTEGSARTPGLVLPSCRMPEAEVSLRLAFYLLGLPGSGLSATVGIDGAHIQVHGKEVFPISSFLAAHGWSQETQRGKNL